MDLVGHDVSDGGNCDCVFDDDVIIQVVGNIPPFNDVNDVYGGITLVLDSFNSLLYVHTLVLHHFYFTLLIHH